MESVISTGGTIVSTASILCADYDDDRELETRGERYEWSLADADIEQLLQAGKGGGPRSRSMLPSGQAASADAGLLHALSDDDNEEEALLEFLEEEVAGSLRLLTPSPDLLP